MSFRRKGSAEGNKELNSYEIWQEKQAAVETAEIEKIERAHKSKGYLRWLNPATYVSGFWSSLLDDKKREAIKVIISMFGILATASAAVGLIWTVWDATEDRKLTQERLITDRFSKAATLLSNDDKAVRIAAIFSLERIAKDSPKDHWTIMELLSAYVLEKSPLSESNKVSKTTPTSSNSPSPGVKTEPQKLPRLISNDVQAALTIIGRRELGQDQERLDLSKRDLSRADLSRADLSDAKLSDAVLRFANLNRADLSLADLSFANLSLANLNRADLSLADLSFANLSLANLSRADLSSAEISLADLSLANLSRANLSRANLSRANLSDANLSRAILLSTDLRKSKKLTKDQLNGKDQPLICNSPLPQSIEIDRNRDCGKVAATLHEIYPKTFSSLDEAEKFVQEQRQKKWD